MTAELKENILRKTEALFFKYGIKSVNMDDIARELAISKKTLYQFFENKTDILKQLVERHVERDTVALHLNRLNAKNALEELLSFARHALQEISKFSSPTIIFDLQKYYPEIWQNFQDFQDKTLYLQVKENVQRGMKEGLYREDLDADIIAKLYVTKTFCVIDEDIFPTKQYDKVKLFKQYFYYHIRGIATAKGIKLLEKYLSETSNEKPS